VKKIMIAFALLLFAGSLAFADGGGGFPDPTGSTIPTGPSMVSVLGK